jgi:uncharacterized protein YndB with AHSA1/START domain
VEVTREVVLEAPVEDVWAALTDPERLEEWFANDVELELEPGGEGVFRWADGEERHAVVETVEHERLFEFSWDDSRVCIELAEVAGGTRVLVRETLGAGWSTALALHAMALAQRV